MLGSLVGDAVDRDTVVRPLVAGARDSLLPARFEAIEDPFAQQDPYCGVT